MNLYQRLQQETQSQREYMLSAPIIQRCFHGEITVSEYQAFLTQAFHHVKHTVPLLMSAGAKLRDDQEWLRAAIGEYIEEEMGHQEWVLNDIAACGGDKDAVRASQPAAATDLMVAYAYDSIARKSPLYFFGMVFVLEGTSIALADKAAGHIKDKLALPPQAFSYLRSHGSLDQEHIVFFEKLMNQITDENEQNMIVHSAQMFFQLYGNIFHTLHTPSMTAQVA